MDPIERLAVDVQALKSRFDEMSLRFAVSEEREKRINDKIDNLAAIITRFSARMGWAVTVVGGVLLVAVGRWLISGQLAGF